MEIEQIKKKIKAISDIDRKKLVKYFYIAMITICVIIAILLIHIIRTNDIEYKRSINNTKNVIFVESRDEDINKFIVDYFKARHNLNYPKIFNCYGRDYYSEIRDNVDAKTIVDTIRYEKTFVLDYENVKVYSAPGYKNNETVALVTYDLLLGFTDNKLPMIIIFYLLKDKDNYVICDKFDVGTSKYIMDCMNMNAARAIYEDINNRVTKALAGNESLKLAYNSLRQYEMNMNGDINYDKTNFLTDIDYKKYDLVKDADEIYNIIMNAKNKNMQAIATESVVNNYETF